MATAPKKATLNPPKTPACCGGGPAGAGDSAAVLRRESASATPAADWKVSPAADDQKNKAAAAVATLIRPEPSANAAAKGPDPYHSCLRIAIVNCLFCHFLKNFLCFSSSAAFFCLCACGVH